ENLVDLETDKVVLEVPSPSNGILKEIKANDGATVTSGQVLAVLETGEGAGAEAAPKQETSDKAEAAPAPDLKEQAAEGAAREGVRQKSAAEQRADEASGPTQSRAADESGGDRSNGGAAVR